MSHTRTHTHSPPRGTAKYSAARYNTARCSQWHTVRDLVWIASENPEHTTRDRLSLPATTHPAIALFGLCCSTLLLLAWRAPRRSDYLRRPIATWVLLRPLATSLRNACLNSCGLAANYRQPRTLGRPSASATLVGEGEKSARPHHRSILLLQVRCSVFSPSPSPRRLYWYPTC